ncbi:MAG: DUF4160 domain-containing protein [Halobacteriovoraceae bacterium]|nr:DUF4160 domain-containing protein [Halobacteriovoraceae bacterium]
MKFYIYPHDHRPPHIHIIGVECEAKFIIETGECISAHGFSQRAINRLSDSVLKYSEDLMIAWREYEGEE